MAWLCHLCLAREAFSLIESARASLPRVPDGLYSIHHGSSHSGAMDHAATDYGHHLFQLTFWHIQEEEEEEAILGLGSPISGLGISRGYDQVRPEVELAG